MYYLNFSTFRKKYTCTDLFYRPGLEDLWVVKMRCHYGQGGHSFYDVIIWTDLQFQIKVIKVIQ
jgi:hypothetical protein